VKIEISDENPAKFKVRVVDKETELASVEVKTLDQVLAAVTDWTKVYLTVS